MNYEGSMKWKNMTATEQIIKRLRTLGMGIPKDHLLIGTGTIAFENEIRRHPSYEEASMGLMEDPDQPDYIFHGVPFYAALGGPLFMKLQYIQYQKIPLEKGRKISERMGAYFANHPELHSSP